ncbi:MAG: potassium channel protein, partial [Acidimicrobiia bacterium]
IARFLTGAGERVVVVDIEPARLAGLAHLHVVGDATEDETLRRAGIERARALVAALATDADNLFVTVSGRALRPDLVIIARARDDASEPKLRRAGATRVVNPQRIGGARMAAFARQPHVVDFLDVVMHDGSLEFRLEEVAVPPGSAIAGRSLRDAQIRDRTGALVLAIRRPDGSFTTNPPTETTVRPGDILIAIGTIGQLDALRGLACAAA